MAELKTANPYHSKNSCLNCRHDGCADKTPNREGRHHSSRVHAEAAGGARSISAHSESYGTVIIEADCAMSHGVKLTLFLLAFNIIGFAEGYLLSDLGLVWLVPILIVTALVQCWRVGGGESLAVEEGSP
jgi:hypothetical protein